MVLGDSDDQELDLQMNEEDEESEEERKPKRKLVRRSSAKPSTKLAKAS